MFVGAAELLQAAYVDHAITAAILHAGQENLIMVKSRVLEIYDASSDSVRLLSCHRFAEPIKGIQRFSPTTKTEPDHLLLCFTDKKFSIVRYSRKINDFITLSMHSFANELLLASSTDLTKKTPLSSDARLLHTDPESRCALYRLDSGNWALLSLEEDEDNKQGKHEKQLHQSSVTFASSKIDDRIKNVVDFCFLEGFFEPTIAVLFEPTFAWPGRLPVAMDTMELIITTLNLKSGSFTTISHQTRLPSECRVLKPIPKPIGGVLLVGPNLFIHLDHISSPAYKSINYHAELVSSSVPSIPVNAVYGKEICVPSSLQMVTKEMALWASESGRLFWLNFKSGSRAVSSLEIQVIEGTLPISVSCIAKIGADRIFIGSAFDDHRIYRFKRDKGQLDGQNQSKKDEDDDLDSFYRDEILGEQSLHCELELSSQLPSMGSASSFALGKSSNSFDIYAVGGFRDTGFLNIVSMGLKGKGITSFELEDSSRLVVVRNDKSGDEGDLSRPSYLVVATPHSTMLMSTSAESMTEIEETAFLLQGQTLLAASLNDSQKSMIVQVCERQALLFSHDTKHKLAQVFFKNTVKSVQILGNLLVALLNDGSLELFRVNSEGSFDPMMLDTSFSAHHIDLITGETLANGNVLLALFADSRDLIFFTISQDDQISPCFSNPLLSFLPQVMSSQPLAAPNWDRLDPPTSMTLVSSADKYALFLVITTINSIVCYRLAEENKLVKICSGNPLDFAFHSPPTKFYSFLGTTGLFFPGTTPTCLCIGKTGYPRIHHLIHHDRLLAIDQFGHNRLVVLTESGRISIEQFNPNTQMDYQLPFIRKSFPEKLHGIIYNASSNTFTVATSQTDSFHFPDDEYSALTDNLEWKPAAHIERAELPLPNVPKMSLKLLSPISWSFVDEFPVEPWEHITALEACCLTTKETTKGSKSFICVGATAIKGEDRPVRGRVLIFDVMDVVPEPGRPETNVKFKQLLTSDMKLPVSGLADIDGYLAVSLGVKTIIHEFEDNETLNGVAFTDCGVFITSTLVLKKYLILGDIKRGLNFYGFQEKPPKVLELGRDPDVSPKPVVHSAALLDGQEVLFVTADEDGVLSFFAYSPATAAERLLKRGCYALGEPISKMTRVLLDGDNNVQHAAFYMTVKGEMGFLTPLSEAHFRTLYPVQNRISQEIPQPAGLNPRASRGSPTARNVLDLRLIGQTVDFPLLAQRALSEESTADTTITIVIKAIYKPFINIFRNFE